MLTQKSKRFRTKSILYYKNTEQDHVAFYVWEEENGCTVIRGNEAVVLIVFNVALTIVNGTIG